METKAPKNTAPESMENTAPEPIEQPKQPKQPKPKAPKMEDKGICGPDCAHAKEKKPGCYRCTHNKPDMENYACFKRRE